MNRLWELILKIFLHSPEMNRSVFFSMYLLWMTKKINYFLRYFVFGERIFPWFNIDPIPSFNENDSRWRASRFSSLWFCFCLRSACKSFALSFNAYSSSWSSGMFVSLLFKFIYKLIWSMRNSDPGVSVVSAQRHNSDLNSMFTVQVTGCNFQYGPNFGVSLDPAFRLWCCFFSWKSEFTTGLCIKLCEISNRIYSFCLVVTASQFVLHTVATEIFDTLSHHSPKELLSWSHWARLRNSIVPSQQVAAFSREGILSIHISLRLLRKDWVGLQKQLCEKVSIVSWSQPNTKNKKKKRNTTGKEWLQNMVVFSLAPACAFHKIQ